MRDRQTPRTIGRRPNATGSRHATGSRRARREAAARSGKPPSASKPPGKLPNAIGQTPRDRRHQARTEAAARDRPEARTRRDAAGGGKRHVGKWPRTTRTRPSDSERAERTAHGARRGRTVECGGAEGVRFRSTLACTAERRPILVTRADSRERSGTHAQRIGPGHPLTSKHDSGGAPTEGDRRTVRQLLRGELRHGSPRLRSRHHLAAEPVPTPGTVPERWSRQCEHSVAPRRRPNRADPGVNVQGGAGNAERRPTAPDDCARSRGFAGVSATRRVPANYGCCT